MDSFELCGRGNISRSSSSFFSKGRAAFSLDSGCKAVGVRPVQGLPGTGLSICTSLKSVSQWKNLKHLQLFQESPVPISLKVRDSNGAQHLFRNKF